jgi:hypothetical protein
MSLPDDLRLLPDRLLRCPLYAIYPRRLLLRAGNQALESLRHRYNLHLDSGDA